MAFIPIMLENFWSPNCSRRRSEFCPSRGHVANDVAEDVLNSIAMLKAMFGPEYSNQEERAMRNMGSTLQQQSRSSVTIDKNKFQANFDVQHFKPEEIIVKVTENHTVTIEAKHEEQQDEHGQIYRHFIRKYVIPENYDVEKIESRLSSEGILTITAPTVCNQSEHRVIPISQTGQPARSVEAKKSEKEEDQLME